MAEPILASILVDAPPYRVYEYFTRAEDIVRWIGDYALLEPEPDGRFELDIRGTPVRGRFLKLEPPHRLVISWGYAGSEDLSPGASTLEVRLIPDGDGTRVEIEHRDLPDEQIEPHQIGWHHYLPRLMAAITSGDAGPDQGMPAVGTTDQRSPSD
jgi:uncharacterized protein YndB with AHSA1/START domain